VSVPPSSEHRSSAIFWAFLRLGLTAFGGPAMVAYIGEMAVKRNWLSRQTFRDGVAICQTIPGATAIQTAAYVGLRAGGVGGAGAAYIGFGLPAFVFMIVLSAVYSATSNLPTSLSIFRGLQIIVVAIIVRAVFTFGRSTVKAWQDAVIALGAAVYLFFHGNPILAILAGASIGMLIYRGAARTEDTHATAPVLRPTAGPAIAITAIGLLILAALILVNRHLFDLGALMLRVDLFAFGGGFASVPVMLHQVTQAMHWMGTRTFMDGIALGQVTPGPIVITATFVGYQVAGIVGAVIATAYVFFPSFVILIFIVPHFDQLKHSPVFQKAMRGILATFVGLLLSVAVGFGMAVSWSPISIVFGLAALTALMLKVDVAWVVLPGAALSVLIFH
jgi:chromate transporter